MPATAKRVDPYITCYFGVEINGIQEAVFRECSGLESEIEVLSYEEGGVNDHPHKLPGRVKFPNVTLKRGVTDSKDLWEWFSGGIKGQIKRKTVNIRLCNAKGEEVKRWSFDGAYPVKWTGPSLNATENSVAIETLELAHEGMAHEKTGTSCWLLKKK
jgi:phage tail-like protein